MTALRRSVAFARHAPRRQRGVVLFISLIVMVAMSLAAIALIRSVDTSTGVVGNLAFRQAAILPANLAVEAAAAALFVDARGGPVPINRIDHLPAENYFATVQPGEDARGIPTELQRKSNFTQTRVLVDQAGNEIRYVIERMCIDPVAVGEAARADICEMLAPKRTTGTTANEGPAPELPRLPMYRVTVRVDGPKNTTSFLQAMLR
ncbi:MAG: hypothetical protein H0X11_12735 [Betaproteobacteria bacterium]|nr:hypothetical protein [Betaproteobacteria bacterium]